MTGQVTKWLLGLGLLAGAVLQPASSAAQDTIRPPVRDTIVRIPIPPQPDTIARRDSAARTGGPAPAIQARADSIQPPLARAPLPVLTDAGMGPLQWTRDSLMATGAVTLADLLPANLDPLMALALVALALSRRPAVRIAAVFLMLVSVVDVTWGVGLVLVAAALAPLLRGQPELIRRRVGVVVTGGNVDLQEWATMLGKEGGALQGEKLT